MYLSLSVIYDLSKTIEKEQYLRMCADPYICIIPPKEWSATQRPLGLTIYERIEV